MVAAGGVVMPSEEFGRPAPNFIAEEIDAGKRTAAEKKQLVKQMKKETR
ncbi:MAG TPA: hypothetical protein VMO52_09150 [Acidimicrobiia bacterium]|nr:hypothetical protein [Acidimicrobiia bacterium]